MSDLNHEHQQSDLELAVEYAGDYARTHVDYVAQVFHALLAELSWLCEREDRYQKLTEILVAELSRLRAEQLGRSPSTVRVVQ